MVRGKKAESNRVNTQAPLLEVPRTQAATEADRYADIQNDIEAKKAMLVQQAEKVVQAMKKSGQRVLSYTDEYGFKHTFTVIETQEKLRHTKRSEA